MFSPFGFSIQEIFICYFYFPKTAFVCEFQHTPLREMIFFLNVPHLLRVWDFEDMYLTHLETRIWRGTFHIYFKKWFFTLLSSLGIGKKSFLSTLNIMILQMVRNEHLRFGGHVHIEVRYKILQLNVLKKTQILHNLSCFE
jgi:hypothetical protein